MSSRALVLWTGGKDCNLALYEARRAGVEVAGLLTFAPPNARFLAHPLPVMLAQAEALALIHRVATVEVPYEVSYRREIAVSCRYFDANCLITGDIDRVDGQPNWVRECCAGLDTDVLTPLWHRPRAELLGLVVDAGFEAVVSCVRDPMETRWLGRCLDRDAVQDLIAIVSDDGADAAGEQGEYHTIVIDGPGYQSRLDLQIEGSIRRDGLTCLDVREVTLKPKPRS